MNTIASQHRLALSITKAASQQTYYTIRFLVDRERVTDAYRAYAYFRWVDDTLDAGPTSALSATASAARRIAFIERQESLLEQCYQGEPLAEATPEENMLVELIRRNPGKNSGLESYLRNMMQVMEFDARRRGRLISQAELNEYTRWLATAVTEAMHYFIGHDCFSPHDETRYLAVTAAHITHMLRDTYDDVQAGYYNIPREVLEAAHIEPWHIHDDTYRRWVQSRIQLARQYFNAGRDYLFRVAESRCRLTGLAYTARFEWVLDTIEHENYSLRPEYNERKGIGAGLDMGWLTLSSLMNLREFEAPPQPMISQPVRKL
ncbi:MAG TPA: squalene/phytoene synthase family protein [Anaerolineales bacterium]|nr:squalene/phytoene synthase family protein [Anaerolineales bacterium]